MSGVNKAIIIGRLGQDPEVKTTQGGKKFATMSVATSKTWKDKDSGEKQEKTQWHRVVVWKEGAAESIQKYLKKGSQVFVEGSLETRKWDDGGVDKYVTEIVVSDFQHSVMFLDRKESSGGVPAPDDDARPATTAKVSTLDDEIPF